MGYKQLVFRFCSTAVMLLYIDVLMVVMYFSILLCETILTCAASRSRCRNNSFWIVDSADSLAHVKL